MKQILKQIFFVGSFLWLQPFMASMHSEKTSSIQCVGGVPMPPTFSIGNLKPIQIKMPTLAEINTAARNRKRASFRSKDDLEDLDEECLYAASQADICTYSGALEWDKKLSHLLEQGADPDYAPNYGGTTFGMVLRHSKLKNILLCLSHGAAIHKVGYNGESALHEIIKRTYMLGATAKDELALRTRVIKKLLEKGANPNARTNSGRTPLYYVAVNCFSVDLIKLLIAGRADPNIGRSDLLPLYYAQTSGQVATLIRAGAHYHNYRKKCASIFSRGFYEERPQVQTIQEGIQIAWKEELESIFKSVSGWPKDLDAIVMSYVDALDEPSNAATHSTAALSTPTHASSTISRFATQAGAFISRMFGNSNPT